MSQIPSTSRDQMVTGTNQLADEDRMSDTTESKPFADRAPGPQPSPLEVLAQLPPADLALLLRLQSAMSSLPSLPSNVTQCTSVPTPTINVSVAPTAPNLNPHYAQHLGLDPVTQLKINSLSSTMRKKFLVPNLNLKTNQTTVPNITEMVMLFAPDHKPTGSGYIRKDRWISAYNEHVRPLLEPFISSASLQAEQADDGAEGYGGYVWEYYQTREFDPSAHWITTEFLADLLKHFCPGTPIPPRRAARERMFRQTVWGDEHEEDPPPPYSCHLSPCAAPHHVNLGVDHLRFTLQQQEPNMLIPTQTSKPTLCKLYELYIQHRERTTDDPTAGVDYFWSEFE